MTGADDPRARGQRARALLEDPLLAEALARILADCRAAWAATRPDEVAERERLYHLSCATERLQGELRAIMADGAFAEAADQAAKRRPAET